MRHLRDVILVGLLASACSSGPTIRSEVAPNVDFGAYRTFSMFAPFGLDRDGFGTPLGSLVRTAVQRELERRGLRLVASGGDLLLNAGGNVVDKQRIDTVPAGYYGYRRGLYGGWAGYEEVHVTDYQEGTLTIDAIDPARKELVWSGTAVGKVTEQARANRATVVPQVVAEIFTRFPLPLPVGTEPK